MGYFTDKVVWVTGASSGIGEALAKALAKEEARIVLSARRTKELERVKNELGIPERNCMILPLDLSEHDLMKTKAHDVIDAFGRIDMLINNGGISQRSEASETGLMVDKRVMDINFFGAVALTKAVLPFMIQNNYGHIITISSIVGKFGFPLRTAYSASKHALQGFFESLRFETRKQGIYTTIVCPGRIKTNISLHAVTKEGEEHGKMDEGQEKGMPADVCAAKILKGVQKKKREIIVGNSETLMVPIKRFFPGLFNFITNRIKPT